MQCSDSQKLLSQYLDGGLDSREQQALLEHLQDCPDCRRQLEELEQLTRQIRDFPRIKAPSGFERRVAERLEAPSWPRRLLKRLFLPWQIKIPAELAAAALFCVVLLLLVQNEPLKQQAFAPSASLEHEASLEEPLQEAGRPVFTQREKEQPRLAAKSAAPQPEQILALHLVPKSGSRTGRMEALDSEQDVKAKRFSSGPSDSTPPLLERIKDLARNHDAQILNLEGAEGGTTKSGLTLSIPSQRYDAFIADLSRFFHFRTPPPEDPARDSRPIQIRLQIDSPS